MADAAEKVTITNRAHAGQPVILPEMGKVQLSADGDIEVSADLANQMLQLGQGWTLKGDVNNTSDEVRAFLKKMTLEEMISLAEKANLPADDYKKMRINQTLMRRYLEKNLDPNALSN